MGRRAGKIVRQLDDIRRLSGRSKSNPVSPRRCFLNTPTSAEPQRRRRKSWRKNMSCHFPVNSQLKTELKTELNWTEMDVEMKSRTIYMTAKRVWLVMVAAFDKLFADKVVTSFPLWHAVSPLEKGSMNLGSKYFIYIPLDTKGCANVWGNTCPIRHSKSHVSSPTCGENEDAQTAAASDFSLKTS